MIRIHPRKCAGALLALLALICIPAVRAVETAPRFFAAKPGALAKARERIAGGDKDLTKALNKLIKDADKVLAENPPSVVEKTKAPPSGDKHDYMSLAPYFWPDPKSKSGLPYIRHDGKVNPESRDPGANDSLRIALMGGSIETLALAYSFTGKEDYAAQAAKFARAWFLDPATRMNPNFKYAQAVLGKNDGRGTGILEARHIAIAADAMGLLAGSAAWTPKDQEAMKAWAGTFLQWLLTSNSGRDEHAAKNNHGTWFDVQTARLALCVGKTDLAARIVKEAMRNRVAVQIEKDGRQPLELGRTKSFSYSCFNLEALSELATLGEHAGVDLWGFATSDGRSIRRGIDFMLPYVDIPAKEWPYEQIKETSETAFLPILRQAALAYHAPEFEAIIEKAGDARSKRFQLLFVK